MNHEERDNGMTRILLLALLLGVAPVATAKETVKLFTGSENATTAIFTVEAPWILDWRVDGDYDMLVAFDVTLVEAHGGRHVGRVLHTKRKGNGVKLFDISGTYQLRISSTLARWRIKIEQLTPEEAELYTPRGQK